MLEDSGPECSAGAAGEEPLTDMEEEDVTPDQPHTFNCPEQFYTTEQINRVLQLTNVLIII